MVVLLPAMLMAGNVIINEVSTGHGTWLELKNTGSTPVNIGGWTISNSGGSDVLPDFTIQPAGYAVIAASRSQTADIYMEDGSIGSGLSTTGDMLVLADAKGRVVDQLNWGKALSSWANFSTGLWSQGPTMPTDGSLCRIPDALDRDLPNDFREITEATPGAENMYVGGLDTPSWGKIKALFSK